MHLILEELSIPLAITREKSRSSILEGNYTPQRGVEITFSLESAAMISLFTAQSSMHGLKSNSRSMPIQFRQGGHMRHLFWIIICLSLVELTVKGTT